MPRENGTDDTEPVFTTMAENSPQGDVEVQSMQLKMRPSG